MNFRTLAAPFVLIPALFRGRRQSDRIYAEDYDRRAGTYDAAKGRGQMGQVSERLVGDLGSIEANRVLDLACGTGQVTAILSERHPNATIDAVDISGAMLDRARERLTGSANVTFHESDMQGFLERANEQYDLVTCMWAIGYANPKRVLRLIARALKPGGRLVVVVNTRRSLVEIQNLYARILLRHPFYLQRVPRIGFPRSVAEFGRWARRAGFGAEHLEEGCLVFTFADGREFVEWLKTAGQSAGLEASMRAERREAILDGIEQMVGDSPFHITHRFVEFIGERAGPSGTRKR